MSKEHKNRHTHKANKKARFESDFLNIENFPRQKCPQSIAKLKEGLAKGCEKEYPVAVKNIQMPPGVYKQEELMTGFFCPKQGIFYVVQQQTIGMQPEFIMSLEQPELLQIQECSQERLADDWDLFIGTFEDSKMYPETELRQIL